MKQSIFLSSGYFFLWLTIWVTLGAICSLFAPALPHLEVSLFSQIWEVWTSDYGFPNLEDTRLNSHTIYQWLTYYIWESLVFSDALLLLMPAFFGFLSILIIMTISRLLWKEAPLAANLGATVLMGTLAWLIFNLISGIFAFSTFCLLVAMYGLLISWSKRTILGPLLTGLATGVGFLASGYIIMAHVLCLAVVAPIWGSGVNPKTLNDSQDDCNVTLRAWYLRVLMIILVAFFIILGNDINQNEQFDLNSIMLSLHTTLTALLPSFNTSEHQIWARFLIILLFLLPWVIWPPIFQLTGRFILLVKDASGRFCVIWFLVSVLIFIFSSKNVLSHATLHTPSFVLIVSYLLYPAIYHEKKMQVGYYMCSDTAFTLFNALIGFILIVVTRLEHVSYLPWWTTEIAGGWGLVLILLAALMAYKHFEQLKWRMLSIVLQMCTLIAVLILSVSPLLKNHFNLEPVVEHIRNTTSKNVQISLIGDDWPDVIMPAKLDGLVSVVDTLDTIGIVAWAVGHPDGQLGLISKDYLSEIEGAVIFPYKNKYITFFPAEIASERPELIIMDDSSDH